VSISSSDATTSRPTRSASTIAPTVDVHALFDQLSAMPITKERIAVAALDPSVRAELRALVEAMAGASEGQ
jgi:hypothetical protein